MESQELTIQSDIDINLNRLKEQFTDAPDFTIKSFQFKCDGQNAFVAYLYGIVDEKKLFDRVLKPLIFEASDKGQVNSIILSSLIKQTSKWQDVQTAILKGSSVLFVDGEVRAYLLKTASWPSEEVKEPQNELSLLGSRTGFTDSADTNIALIRHYFPDIQLSMKNFIIGSNHTKATIAYLSSKADPQAVEELSNRIQKVNTEGIMNTRELVEQLEDQNFSLFPQLLVTERPDVTASALMEGKIAVLTDHSSHVLIGPMTFLSFFLSIDDVNLRWPIVTFQRMLRFIGLLIAVFLPSIYIATVSFHYEIIPIDLVLSIGKSLERVPIPPILEALFMELLLEMLREASLRLPPKVGQSVGIVGGIVIGQAAVEAGIVSNVMVIVVALTAIASFIQPNQDMAAAIRMLRFPFMIAAYLLGLVGIVIGIMILAVHIISLQSLKYPYGSPLFPVRIKDWKQMIARFPRHGFHSRVRKSKPHDANSEQP